MEKERKVKKVSICIFSSDLFILPTPLKAMTVHLEVMYANTKKRRSSIPRTHVHDPIGRMDD